MVGTCRSLLAAVTVRPGPKFRVPRSLSKNPARSCRTGGCPIDACLEGQAGPPPGARDRGDRWVSRAAAVLPDEVGKL